jgi:hypothetical protein
MTIVEIDRDDQSHRIITVRPTTSPNQNPELNNKPATILRPKGMLASYHPRRVMVLSGYYAHDCASGVPLV